MKNETTDDCGQVPYETGCLVERLKKDYYIIQTADTFAIYVSAGPVPAEWTTFIGRDCRDRALIGRELKYFHDVATPAPLCHKEPAQGTQGSLWHKGAYNRTFLCMEATYHALRCVVMASILAPA